MTRAFELECVREFLRYHLVSAIAKREIALLTNDVDDDWWLVSSDVDLWLVDCLDVCLAFWLAHPELVEEES